ncbi:MAG: hypothetical protein KAS73_09755 [Candidatus Sabulitectum sp.]|nr:hypothetical protein [Candidatus Sabulitectum sp.]
MVLGIEFEYYLKEQDNLVKRYNGKYIVIKGREVLGAYDSETEAIRTTMKDHELGTFMVQLCTPGSSSYTQTFHSRVAFA